jgi:hypothetical protein
MTLKAKRGVALLQDRSTTVVYRYLHEHIDPLVVLNQFQFYHLYKDVENK